MANVPIIIIWERNIHVDDEDDIELMPVVA